MAFFDRLNVAVAAANHGGPNGPAIQAMHTFENDLIAQGWRVLGSGDTYSFENTGQTDGSTGTGPGGGFDVITSAAGGEHNGGGGGDTRVVGGLGNIWGFPYTDGKAGSSWRRIATPVGAEHYREYLISHQWKFNQNTSRHYWVVYLARDAATFNANGSPTDLPLPADETLYVCLAGRQNPSATGAGSSQDPAAVPFFCGAAGYAHWFIGDAGDDFDFLFWTTRTSERSIFRMFGQLRLVNTFAEQIGKVDDDPYLYVCAGTTSDSGSIDIGRSAGFCFRHEQPNNFEPKARLEDRQTANQQYSSQGGGQGIGYASWGRWTVDPEPDLGTFSVTFWSTLPVGNTTFAALADILDGPHADGKSLVLFNPVVGRATNEAVSELEFYKGQVKGRLIGLTGRFDDPSELEDETGPNGASTGRRLSAGYLHLLWKDNTGYSE